MDPEAARAAFEENFPPGYLGLQKAYAPDGSLGRWLVELPLVIRVNDRLYMHGGASSAIVETPLDEINEQNKADLREYLQRVESLRDAGVLGRHVDFWGRRLHLNGKAEAVLAEVSSP